MIITNARLRKIIRILEANESDIKNFGNFMHDYSIDPSKFGSHELDDVKNINGHKTGLLWIRRTYGFGLKAHTIEVMMNEYLFMKQEIERLQRFFNEYESLTK